MMSRTTPGPWKVARQGVSLGWLIYSDFERGAAGAVHYIAQNLRHEADARLVAKAPEMREMLWNVLEYKDRELLHEKIRALLVEVEGGA